MMFVFAQLFRSCLNKLEDVYLVLTGPFKKCRITKWKFLYIGLGAVVVLACIMFSVPLKEVSYEVEYTYYDTEVIREPYVANKMYSTEELQEKKKIFFDGFSLVLPAGVNIPFTIDKPDAVLMVSFENSVPGGLYIYSVANHIIFEKLGASGNFELSLPEGNYRALFRENLLWGEEVYISLAMRWNEIEKNTNYQEVTRYYESSVEVEKRGTAVEYKKVSMWDFIFGY